VDGNGQNGHEGNKVAEEKSGSVTVSIFKSQNSRKIFKQPVEGTYGPQLPEIKFYDSFVIPWTLVSGPASQDDEDDPAF